MGKPWAILAVLLAGAVGSGWFAYQRTHAHRHRLPQVNAAKAAEQYHKQVLPLLNKYCWDCHADGEKKGDVALDDYTNLAAIFQSRRVWEQVLHNVQAGDMPPKKKRQPSDAERASITGWIEQTLFPVDPENPDPGRVTLRRLNRAEYNNTIRDLIGLDFHPADDFPQDDLGYGFDNIGDVLSLPPLLFEKYVVAAERILDEAIVTGPRKPPTLRFKHQQFEGGGESADARILASNGEVTIDATLSRPGRYEIRFQGYGDQAGPDPVKTAVRADGQELAQVEVRAVEKSPKVYSTPWSVTEPGRKRFAVAFLNDYYVERYETKTREGKPPERKKITEDRNFYCQWIEVVGPLDAEEPLPESHQRIFVRLPRNGDDTDAAREVIAKFARRAWRRPVAPREVERIMSLYFEATANHEKFEAAVKHALTAVLVSPHFLFRNELQAQPDNPAAVVDIDEHALASRLSYFLWSSMPDEELFQLADAGKLRRNLDAQVDRMLLDPKANALTKNFADQWLGLRALEQIDPDKKTFPDFNNEIRRSMREETERFFEHIVRQDRPVDEFLTAQYTFLNEPLAKYYGIDGVSGPQFRQVTLTDGRREGLLTQGSILTLTSNPTRTSPVKRGKWVLENLLATPPPPPPPNVPPLEAGEKLTGSLRHRMEKHRENAMCASCHAKMDPIGFAFEHFDGVGRWRETDGKDPVETAGVLDTSERFNDHTDLIKALAGSRRADFNRCLVEKTLTYSLGRGLEYYDRPAVQKVIANLARNQNRFSALIHSVVHSAPFQQRRGDGDPASVTGLANR